MNNNWIGDECGYEEPEHEPYRGEAYIHECDEHFPVIRNPIGFDLGNQKPRIRIKAWTRPIL